MSHIFLAARFVLVSCLAVIFDPEEGGGIFLLTHRLAYTGLHGLISQNTYIAIATAVRTTNPTYIY
jgi:hypothetical protein